MCNFRARTIRGSRTKARIKNQKNLMNGTGWRTKAPSKFIKNIRSYAKSTDENNLLHPSKGAAIIYGQG